jgi:F-type H+-transporting ATPase subunit delta
MIVASRYAKSILDLSIERNMVDEVYKDMQFIRLTCESSHELQVFLKNPVIKMDKKIEVFSVLFFPHITDLSKTYLELVARKKRSSILAEITNSFQDQYKKYKNITTATITSAVQLDESSRKKALEIVKKGATGEVELIEKINPELIGGFILRVGDMQVDNSVVRQLQNLKKNFNTKTVSIN